MGVCLSRCGDAQQKAGVVAASISHQNSLEPMNPTDSSDPNHSLKTFLHLYEIAESSKRSFTSPRASLGDCLHIPHSSELFSLPDSDVDRSSCCTPARTSRASISSRATNSPKSTRNSFSVWGGRFSTDRTISVGCRKKIRPARSSKGGDHDVAAHQRLVEAIARLERLNNGKNLELRGSSFHRSDLDANPRHVLTKSRSGEIKRPSSSSTGRHHRHNRHKAPPQPVPQQKNSNSQCPHEGQCDSCRVNDLDDLNLTFSQCKNMGSLVAMAGPIIKQRPLEKSVTNFLKEVENFVSLIEAPRLSLSSEAALRESLMDEPLIITTYSRSDREDTDSDEQFTFFEASFGSSDCPRKPEKSSGDVTSLQRLVQSAAQDGPACANGLTKAAGGEELGAMENQIVSPSPSPAKRAAPEKESFSIYEDPNIESKQAGKGADAARPVLTDVDTNVVTPTSRKSPVVTKSPAKVLTKAPRGFRRGLSRSLDSRDQGCSVTKVDFNVFRTGPTQVTPPVMLPVPTPAEGGRLIEAKSPEFGPEVGLVQEPEGKLGQPGSEEKEML